MYWQLRTLVLCLLSVNLVAGVITGGGIVAVLSSATAAADSTGQEKSVGTTAFPLDEARQEDLMRRGKSLFAEQCASCHGEKGEGVSGAYETPLTGDRSVRELASVIERTMPEGEPEACQGEDALATAIYAYETFYSEESQVRNAPPRAALARLTTEQFRQSLSDIYAHFHRIQAPDKDRGLRAVYFDNDGWNDKKKAFERTDAKIDFDYGEGSPGDGIGNKEFAIYWNGGLLVPETGRYELIARGLGAFKVSFINLEKPFFDNHVQSGDVAEFKSSVELMGGRVYPLKVEFIKRARKTGTVSAKFSLSWRTPGGVEQVIPTRYLVPGWYEKAFAPQTPMPADDRSAGYERGSTISRQWDDATTKAAIEFANVVTDDLWPHYAKQRSKQSKAPQGRELLREFAYKLVDVAVRRPAGEEVRKVYVDEQLAATDDDEEALRRVVILTLKSPRFLYPSLHGGVSADFQHSIRLAQTLWDSVPNEMLWSAAEQGKLKSEAEIRLMAGRMLDDLRTRAKTREALHHWLNLSHIAELTKNNEQYPNFDAALVSDLRMSLDLFLDAVIWSESSDFRQLLQADWTFSSDRIAKFYGEAWTPTGESPDGDFSRTTSNAKLRSGVLTHPYLMSALAYNDTTSPIHRGVFLTRFMLGRVMRPPSSAFSPLSPDLHADLTTRERVQLQTGVGACQSCHSIINSLGFSLEQFDAVGMWREQEKAKPIDAQGSYIDREGKQQSFNGSLELSNYLVNSKDAQTAFINRMFLHFVKQPIAAYGPEALDQMHQKFRDSGFSVRQLLIEIAVVATLGPVSTPTT